jgi:hypothetical protein
MDTSQNVNMIPSAMAVKSALVVIVDSVSTVRTSTLRLHTLLASVL